MPQEEMLEIKRKKGQLFIGIPKETSFQERRVALVPEAVSLLVANGHRVMVETGAGDGTNFSDTEYSEAGAEISYDKKAVYSCNIIFKVAPPSEEEIELMPGNQTFISALQISTQPKEILQKLMHKKTTCIAWDYIRDEEGVFSVVRTMGEIDDVEQAKNNRQSQRQQCIKRAVDQTDQQLTKQRLRGNAKDFHVRISSSPRGNHLHSKDETLGPQGWWPAICSSRKGL